MTELKVVATASDDQTHEGDAQSVHIHGNVFTCGEDGKVKFTIPKQLVTKPSDDIEALLVHAGRVLTCSGDGRVKIWDHNNLKLLQEFKAHDYCVTDLLVVGKTLFTCSVDASIKTWDLETLQLKKLLSPHAESVRKLVTDGTNVFAGDDEGEVRVYDKEGEFVSMYGVVEEVWGLHAQDNLLYTVRDRGLTITQTKGKTNQFTVTKSLDGRAPLCVVGNHLTFADTSGLSVCVHDNTPGSYKLRGQLQGHEMIITALAGWGEDRLVSSGWDNEVRLWDLSALKGLASCRLPGCPNGLACSQDGCVYAAGIGGFLCKMKTV